MKVSVIVAAYNVASEIERCLQSLHAQMMQDAEFLIIDDGSTDETATVIKNYLNKVEDDRFKYLYKENGGLSDARNYGLQKASGEYIWFVDGDDTVIGNDTMNNLYQTAKQNNLDVLVFNFKYDDTWDKKYANKIALPDLRYSKQVISGLKLINSKVFNFSVWHMLYNRLFLINNNYFFEKNSMAEDLMFNANVLIKTSRTMFTNVVGYCYYYRANSLTKTINKGTKLHRLNDVLRTVTIVDKMITKHGVSENSNLANSLVRSYLSCLIEGCATGYLFIPKKDVRNFLKNKKLGFKDKIKAIVFEYFPRNLQILFVHKVLKY